MDRPLWQVFLTLFVVAFVVPRGAIAGVVLLHGSASTLLIGYLCQTAAALLAAVGLWLDRAWASRAILALGFAAAATALVEVVVGVRPAALAASQVLVAAVSAAILCLILRRAFGPPGAGGDASSLRAPGLSSRPIGRPPGHRRRRTHVGKQTCTPAV
jgi:hypothetical protein